MLQVNIYELVISRHSRGGGNPETRNFFKKNGFPIKNFGNDNLENVLFTVMSIITDLLRLPLAILATFLQEFVSLTISHLL